MLQKRFVGFKEAKVIKKVQESKNVTSFYIKLLDNEELPKFIAGQFISVKAKDSEGNFHGPRAYSLSTDYNEDYYRISVKREAEGDLSKVLCDQVNEGDIIEITAPIGKFVLKEDSKPLVLIGGGIGITPMLSMAYEALDSDRDIYLIYSVSNSDNHSFKEEIKELGNNNNRFKKILVYTRPTDKDLKNKEFDLLGRISLDWMQSNLPVEADYYFCGPNLFMKAIYKNLISMNVQKENINYELFGAGPDITK